MAKKIVFSGYSDDCGGITGVKDDEYDVPGTWYPLVVDGVRVAKVRLEYGLNWGNEWSTEVVPDKGHTVVVGPKLGPGRRSRGHAEDGE